MVSDASMITMGVMMVVTTMMFRCCMVIVYGDGDDGNDVRNAW